MTSFFKSKMPLVYFVTSLHRSWGVWLGVVELLGWLQAQIHTIKTVLLLRLRSGMGYQWRKYVISREYVLVVCRECPF